MTKMSYLPTGPGTTRLRVWIPLVIILLAFFALWLWDLGYPSLSGDESFVATFASKPLDEIFQRLNSDEPHPPIYYVLMHGWSLVAGMRPEFIVRFPSLLFGLLLLSLTYRLGRDLGLSPYLSLLPVLLVGFLPHVLVHIREARMYGLMLVSIALLTLAAVRFERLPGRAGLLFAAGTAVLALLTHYFSVLFVATIGVWGVFGLRKGLRRRWIISQGAAWVLFAIWLPLFGRGFFNPSSLSQGKNWSFTLPPWEAFARIIRTAVFGYRDSAEVGWLVLGGALLIVGALLGALYYSKPKRALLLACMTLPLLGYVLLGWFKPIFHPKYVLPWLLYAALAFGGLVASRRRLGSLAYIGLLVLMVVPMYRTVRRPYDPGLAMSRNEWLQPVPRELSLSLQHLLGPSDVFGMGTPDAAHCYYSQSYFNRDLGCELIPRYPNQPPAELGLQLDEILGQHEVLWYLDFYNPYWDPEHAAQSALMDHAVDLGQESLAGRRLELYASPATIRRGLFTTAATFGDVAQLDGVWLTAGHDLHLALAWMGLVDRPTLDAKVFVHLINADGQIVAQQDGVPVHWTRPFATWRRDEDLLDVYTLPVPEGVDVNQLSLRIGLYHPDSGVRVPAHTRSGERLADDALVFPVRAVLGQESAQPAP
jgi:hypothetical protein